MVYKLQRQIYTKRHFYTNIICIKNKYNKLLYIMSDNFVNQITLDCLMNKEQYNKYLANNCSKKINRKDKRFYRKRIYYLTKELLLGTEEPVNLFPDVKYAFDNYVKSCIQYFKTIDSSDIIQMDYQNIEDSYNIGNSIPELNVEDMKSKEEADKLLMRSIYIAPSNLDNFVTRKLTKTPEEMIMPKQKNIDLKDPILKNKGICKKKNITNKYDETNVAKKETKNHEENSKK